MKAILKPDDESEMRDMINGPKYASAVFEMREFLRGVCKHRELSGEASSLAHEIKTKFAECFYFDGE